MGRVGRSRSRAAAVVGLADFGNIFGSMFGGGRGAGGGAAQRGPEPGSDLEYQVQVDFWTLIRGGVTQAGD